MKNTSILSLIMLMVFFVPANTLVISANSSFNYAEALQKAIYFYECQQAGPLPSWNRVQWRGDSTMNDYVTGGWYDAGDHVKFNLPMAYSAAMLGWALYEYPEGFDMSGQRVHMENNLRFVLDYLADCNKGSTVVYQIGDGAADHKWWGPVEVIEKEMERPYYTGNGSAVTAQMADALAIGSIVLMMIIILLMLKAYLKLQIQKVVMLHILKQLDSMIHGVDFGMNLLGLQHGYILQQMIFHIWKKQNLTQSFGTPSNRVIFGHINGGIAGTM